MMLITMPSSSSPNEGISGAARNYSILWIPVGLASRNMNLVLLLHFLTNGEHELRNWAEAASCTQPQ